MRNLTAALIATLTAASLYAAPAPYPVTINSRSQSAPPLPVFRANEHTFRVSFTDGGTASDVTGYIPFLNWSTNSGAAVVSTSSWAFVTATNGTVDFTFDPTAINYPEGRYTYNVGVKTSNDVVRSYSQGVFQIYGSPTASGASAVQWVAFLDWNNIIWTNLPSYATHAETTNAARAVVGASGTVWRAEWVAGDTAEAALRASGDVKGTNYTDAVALTKVSTTDPAYLAACTGSVYYAGLTTYVSNRVTYIGTNAFAAAAQTNVSHNSLLGIGGAGTLHVTEAETNRIALALTNTPTLQQVVTAGGTNAAVTGVPSLTMAAGAVIIGQRFGNDAGLGASGNYWGAFGNGAGLDASGNYWGAFGTDAGSGASGNDWGAYGYGAGLGASGNYWGAFGYDAGYQASGNYWGAFGYDAGYQASGNDWGAYGYGAGYDASGNNWGAFGYYAGLYAIHTNSHSFGRYAGYSARKNNRMYLDVYASSPNYQEDGATNDTIFMDTDGKLYLGGGAGRAENPSAGGVLRGTWDGAGVSNVPISGVTGLQSALDGKVPTNGMNDTIHGARGGLNLHSLADANGAGFYSADHYKAVTSMKGRTNVWDSAVPSTPAGIAAAGGVTTNAIPGPGCTYLGTSQAVTLTGATTSYRSEPAGVYTVSVAQAASRYTYALEVISTNPCTLAAGLNLQGSWTITGTNILCVVPCTGTLWRVYGRGL